MKALVAGLGIRDHIDLVRVAGERGGRLDLPRLKVSRGDDRVDQVPASANQGRIEIDLAGDEPRMIEHLTGVTPELAVKVREALDSSGHPRVRIVASGGFDVEKIERFEECRAPVDSYGVGPALLRGEFDFTADIVELGGRPAAKAGRELRPNPRLREVG